MKLLLKFCPLCMLMLLVTVNRSWAVLGWFWQNPLPQGNTLWSVSVLDANTVIAVGDAGTVMKTTDGSVTWAVQHHAGGTTAFLRGVSFVDAKTGTVVGGYGTILHTNMGGE